MRRSVLASAAAASALAVAVIAPGVSNAADTTVTFTVTGGALTITAPLTASLSGLQATGGISDVVVSDQRLGVLGWIATAASSPFNKPAPDPVSILPTNVTYQGTVADVTGTALVTRTPLPVIIALPTPVQTATLVLGANTATWTGDLAVTLPPVGVVAGLYTGTVTHSVA
jgi:hypothetical protein